MRIGIPRALYFFKYGDIWESFFKEVGCETIISPPTNKKMLTQGVDLAVEEVCIPLKTFYGHCLNLKNRCDFVFIPRYISFTRDTFTCPKFLVLPDITRFTIPELPILTTSIKRKDRPGLFQLLLLGMRMRRKTSLIEGIKFLNVKKMRRNLKLIQNETNKEQREDRFHSLLKEGKPKIMLIGHPYNLNDTYVSRDIEKKLENIGATVITPEDVPSSLIEQELAELPFIYWSEEHDIAGTAYLGLKDSRIQGIILVSSFGCGPDSLITEQIIRDARRFGKPAIQLFLDENISDVNIQTRIEAFLDMLQRQK